MAAAKVNNYARRWRAAERRRSQVTVRTRGGEPSQVQWQRPCQWNQLGVPVQVFRCRAWSTTSPARPSAAFDRRQCSATTNPQTHAGFAADLNRAAARRGRCSGADLEARFSNNSEYRATRGHLDFQLLHFLRDEQCRSLMR